MPNNASLPNGAAMLRTISDNPLFRNLSRATLEAFIEHAQPLHARRGASIYHAGSDWKRLGFVLDGTVAMLASEGGDRQHLYERIGPGGFFGVSAVLDGEPEMSDTVVLSQSVTYAWIPRERVLALCHSDPTLALALATVIARRLRSVTALLSEQLNLSTRERLARFLLNFSEGTGMRSALSPLPAMTQSQIAAAAGTVKEVVARLVGEFESDGALRREGGHIRYLNRRRLIRLAAGTGYDEKDTSR